STAAAGTATGVRAVSTGAKATKQVSTLQKLLNVIKDFITKLKTWFSDLSTNVKRIMGEKQLSSVRSTLGVADGRGGLVDKFRSQEGMLGERVLNEEGFRGALKDEAVTAAKDTVGIGDTPGETVRGVTEKAGGYAKDSQEASDHDDIGSDQSADETRDQLDF
ncbi:MAG: hypothetical protein ACRDSE_20325, partial [Pseudonocardiaceae bacterium]